MCIHVIFKTSWGRYYYYSILQMRKWRHGTCKYIGQSHTDTFWAHTLNHLLFSKKVMFQCFSHGSTDCTILKLVSGWLVCCFVYLFNPHQVFIKHVSCARLLGIILGHEDMEIIQIGFLLLKVHSLGWYSFLFVRCLWWRQWILYLFLSSPLCITLDITWVLLYY